MRFKNWIFVLSFLVVSFTAGIALATTYYVRTDGLDSNTGLGNSPLAAFRTIQHSVDMAVAGDVVEIQEGVYNEQVLVPNGGTTGQRIIVKGNGKVTLDGQNSLNYGILMAAAASNVDFIDLEIRNYVEFALYSGGSYDNRIEDCDIHDNGRAFGGYNSYPGSGGQYFKRTKFYNHTADWTIRPYYASKGLTFEECDFYNNRGIALYWAHNSDKNYVIKCRFWNNDTAFHTGDLIGSLYVYNSTFYNNGTAISLWDDRAGTYKEFKNNIIVNNTTGFWRSPSNGGTVVNEYNDVWNNGANYAGIIVAGPNDISVDPLLVSPAAGDFHLQPTSPCVNAGTNLGYPYIGTAPDMGAYESNVNIKYYVRTDGLDSNTGLGNSPLAAFRTIQHSVDMAVAGDVVEIQEGVYNEQVLVPNGGTTGQRIIVKGNGKVTLDGQNSLNYGILMAAAASNVDFIDLEIRNYVEFALYSGGSYDNRIEDCDIHDNGRAFGGYNSYPGSGGQYFKRTKFYNHTADWTIRPYYASKGLTFEECDFYNNRGIALYWAHNSDKNYVIKCRFWNNDTAFHTGDLIGSLYVYNSTFYNNGTAISLWDDRAGTYKEFKNNIIVNNTTGFWRSPSNGGTVVNEYNDVWNNGANYAGIIVAGPNDISVDPLLVSPAAGDFHLQPFSPCIDRGVALGYAYYGAAPDLGAYEKIHSSTIATLDGTAAGNGWYVSDVTVNIADDITSALKEIRYAVDSNVEEAQPSAPASFTVTAEGNHTVTYYAVDNGGATEPVKSIMVKIDKAPPVTTATLQGTSGSNGTYSTIVNVNLSAADSASGVKELRYSIDGGAEVIVSSAAATFTLTSNGSHTISYYAIDNVGFREATKSQAVLINGSIDLTATTASVPANANTGQVVTVNATVANIGPVAAGYFYVSLYLRSASGSDIWLADRVVNGLAPGASNTADTVVTIPANTVPGTYTIVAKADSYNYVVETNETNNTLLGNQIAIGGSDLFLTQVSGPATALTGTAVTVRNTATADATKGAAAYFYVSLYLRSASGSDIWLADRVVNGLAPGASNTADTVVTIPANTVPGTYTIVAKADSYNYVVETNETNNTLAGNQVTIQ